MHLISSRGLLYVYEISPEGHIFFIDNARVADSLFIFDMTHRKLNAYPLSFRVKDNIRWDSRIFFHRKNVFTISTSREGYFEYVYHPASAAIEQISARNAENYLARYVFQDHAARYWIGTDAGLIRTMSLGPQITNIPVEPYVKKDKYVPVSSVYYSSGRWWVSGFSRESGLLVFDSVMQFIRKVDFEKSPDRNFILSVSDWNADSLLIGTKSGAWLMNTKTYQAEPFFPGWSKLNTTGVIIETAFRDSKGILWLSGGQVGGIWKIDQEKKSINHYKPGIGTMDLPVRSVSALAEDSQGNLLMTHWMDGLVKWNRKSGQFELVIKNFPFSEIKNYGCSGIAMGEDDQLWMYVNFYGLVKYNLRDHSFQRMVAVNDQAEDDVDCLTITNRKKIWVTLRHSMLIYDILSGTHYKLTAKNGLPDRMNTAGRLFYSPEKQIAATGFTNTITLIDLQSAERFFPSSPVHITGVYSFREKDFLPLGSSFNLRHRNNDLQVNFSIPDLDQVLSAPVYEYRLSRGDEWKFVGSTGSLQLSNLAAGNYNVEIRMANDSKQNVGASAMFSFSIVPPFHRTVWFYLLAAGFTFFLAYIIYRIRHNQQAALNRVRKNISTDLHDEIGSRLTHIRVLSTLGENMGLSKEEREIHLKKISDEALSSGNALDEIVQNLLMTKETLEDLPALMRHYAGDIFPNSYPEVTFIIPENAGNGLLKNELKKDLFLVFKEILNNIQKHAGATEVRVEMNESGRVLELVISDNGRGFNPELDNRRNGLKNIKSRIQKWKGKFMIHSSAGKGTEIGIALPIHKKSYLRRMFKKNHFA